MKSPFEDTGLEDALTEVEFTLNVFCSQDNTLSVTSNDLVLSDPDIRPVGELPNCPDDKVRMCWVYLKYWTLNHRPLMVYPKVLFPPNFIIKARGVEGHLLAGHAHFIQHVDLCFDCI